MDVEDICREASLRFVGWPRGLVVGAARLVTQAAEETNVTGCDGRAIRPVLHFARAMAPDLSIAYRAGIAKGYPPRNIVLLAVNVEAPNAAHYFAWLPADPPGMPWCYGARHAEEAFALLDEADRARAIEVYVALRLADVLVIYVAEDGGVKLATERRPERW